MDLRKAQTFLREFARDRDWEQYHTPKNLSMGMSGEAAELMEVFQWLTPDQSKRVMEDPAKAEAVRDEIADVFQYVIRMADVLDIDLEGALWTKLRKNEKKYPAHLARGNAKKYNELRQDSSGADGAS